MHKIIYKIIFFYFNLANYFNLTENILLLLFLLLENYSMNLMHIIKDLFILIFFTLTFRLRTVKYAYLLRQG